MFQCTCGVQVVDACLQWASSPRAIAVSLGHDSSLWFTWSPSSSCCCYHQLPQGQPPIGWHITQCRGMASWWVLQIVTKVSVTISQLILDWLLISTDNDTSPFKTKLRQQINKIIFAVTARYVSNLHKTGTYFLLCKCTVGGQAPHLI